MACSDPECMDPDCGSRGSVEREKEEQRRLPVPKIKPGETLSAIERDMQRCVDLAPAGSAAQKAFMIGVAAVRRCVAAVEAERRMACETPTPGCECPGCSYAREVSACASAEA